METEISYEEVIVQIKGLSSEGRRKVYVALQKILSKEKKAEKATYESLSTNELQTRLDGGGLPPRSWYYIKEIVDYRKAHPSKEPKVKPKTDEELEQEWKDREQERPPDDY